MLYKALHKCGLNNMTKFRLINILVHSQNSVGDQFSGRSVGVFQWQSRIWLHWLPSILCVVVVLHHMIVQCVGGVGRSCREIGYIKESLPTSQTHAWIAQCPLTAVLISSDPPPEWCSHDDAGNTTMKQCFSKQQNTLLILWITYRSVNIFFYRIIHY